MNPPATATDDAGQIDTLIARFFAVFDNRDGRIATVDSFTSLFVSNACIASHGAGGIKLEGPLAFVEPRLALLRSGRLLTFHEWETSHQTEIIGTLASRRACYRKQGLLDGMDYAGTGTKFFQLARLEGAWRIVSLSWIDDTP